MASSQRSALSDKVLEWNDGAAEIGDAVEDLQWRFGVTAASADGTGVGVTYVQLKLTLRNKAGKVRTVVKELPLPQFYKLLADIERADQMLDDMVH